MSRILSNFDNLILNTDTYKHSHWNLYPAGTEHISSYIESRGGLSRPTCLSVSIIHQAVFVTAFDYCRYR